VFVGIGAGGSEVSGAAGVSRRDAPKRVEALATLLHRVVRGQPLDPSSGRALEVPLYSAPVLIAGRANGMLTAAGRWADRALLWAVPTSDLARSAAVIAESAQAAARPQPEVVWAPLVDHGGQSRQRVQTIAAYSVLNSGKDLQARWGLDRSMIDRLREVLVGGGAAAAQNLVPAAALDDLIIQDPSPERLKATARQLGATSMALPAFTTDEVTARVKWAREVLG